MEKAEQLALPSLVGLSIRSADDLPHNNYIHPEKYSGRTKKGPKKTLLNSAIGASLDDLISEGALLGSEEDFEKFLDEEGHVKDDARYLEKGGETLAKNADSRALEAAGKARAGVSEPSALGKPDGVVSADSGASSSDSGDKGPLDADAETSSAGAKKAFYAQEDYSTPNLSEFQLQNDIKDHQELLQSVQSYDLSKLPTSNHREVGKAVAELLKPAPPRLTSVASSERPASQYGDDNVRLSLADGIHQPYFPTDRRSRSESRTRSRTRLASRTVPPHLARGDSYKNTHVADETSKYELPADLESGAVEEEEEDDRRTRQSKPTMSESIAAAEAAKSSETAAEGPQVEVDTPRLLTRDPSLVTTGDYTNFDVDAPEPSIASHHLYLTRSQSSTNYLRSISRSRSRQSNTRDRSLVSHMASPLHQQTHEKNDADPNVLAEEGALVNDDPYDTIGGLDTMVEEVLHPEKKATAESEGPVAKKGEKTETAKNPLKKDDEGPSEPLVAAGDESLGVPIGGAEDVDEEPEKNAVVVEDSKEKESKKEGVEKEGVEKETVDESKDNDASILEKHSAIEKDDISVEKQEHSAINEEEPSVGKEETSVEKEALDETPVEKLPAADEAKRATEEISTKDTASEDPSAKETTEQTIASKEAPVDENDEEPTLKELHSESKPEHSGEYKLTGATLASNEAAESSGAAPAEKTSDKEVPEASIAASEKEHVTATAGHVSKEAPTSSSVDDDEDFDVSPEELRKHLESQPVYIFTSLAGGMQITQKTNRLVTILTANEVKFTYRDLGTDEEAKKIWRRQANGKTLPGVVRGDDLIGNWKEIDEANEEYRVRELLYETL